MTRPAGKADSMEVKTVGRSMNIRACTGSTGCGLSFCCRYIVTPMIKGQAPIATKLAIASGGVNGNRPNRLTKVVGSGADKSWIQPKNGACRISSVTNSTLYSEKNTGIWI